MANIPFEQPIQLPGLIKNTLKSCCYNCKYGNIYTEIIVDPFNRYTALQDTSLLEKPQQPETIISCWYMDGCPEYLKYKD